MSLLLNIVLAVLAFLICRWVLGALGLEYTLAVLLSLVVAVVVFLQGFGARF